MAPQNSDLADVSGRWLHDRLRHSDERSFDVEVLTNLAFDEVDGWFEEMNIVLFAIDDGRFEASLLRTVDRFNCVEHFNCPFFLVCEVGWNIRFLPHFI